MKEVLTRLTPLGQGDTLRAQLVRAWLGSGGIQLLNAPLALVTASALARYWATRTLRGWWLGFSGAQIDIGHGREVQEASVAA
jgi:hypothetical protein